MANRKPSVHLYLFGAALMHAAQYSLAQFVMDGGIKPFSLIVIRVFIGGCLFWGLHFFTKTEKIDKADWGRLVACAVFGAAANILIFYQGLTRTTTVNASLIMVTTPILVLIISAIVSREKVTLTKTAGILIGLAGVLLLKWKSLQEFNTEALTGDAMIFANAVFYGIYLVIAKPLMQKYHPFTLFKWIFLIGFFIDLPFGLPGLVELDWSAVATSVWIGAICIGTFTTFIPYVFNALALRTANPSLVGSYIYLQPILTSIIALFIVGESITWLKAIAGVVIFIGVYLVSRKQPAASS